MTPLARALAFLALFCCASAGTKEDGIAFLHANAMNDGVVVLPTGLQYKARRRWRGGCRGGEGGERVLRGTARCFSVAQPANRGRVPGPGSGSGVGQEAAGVHAVPGACVLTSRGAGTSLRISMLMPTSRAATVPLRGPVRPPAWREGGGAAAPSAVARRALKPAALGTRTAVL